MTRKQRLLAILKGEPIDRLPFAPNAEQWFYAKKYNGTLPPEYQDCEDGLEFHARLGADVMTRWEGQVKGKAGIGSHVRFPNARYTVEEVGPDLVKMPITTAFNEYKRFNRVRRTLETPHGTLTQLWRFTQESCADFEEKFWISDLDKDWEALRFMVQDRTYDYDMSEWKRDYERLGDAGLILIEIPENPIKMLHWLMGPEKATLAMIDQYDRCMELFAMHTDLTLRFVDEVCTRTTYEEAPILLSNDNLDAMLMPPAWFDLVLYDHYQKVAERIHANGRVFSVHSCGNNWHIRHCIKASNIDLMEGLTPPPLGNFPLHLAREEMGDDFIVEGGMYFTHQELKHGAKEAIRDYTIELFDQMKDTKKFIYSTSCNFSPNTPVDNLHYFRDYCFEYWKREG